MLEGSQAGLPNAAYGSLFDYQHTELMNNCMSWMQDEMYRGMWEQAMDDVIANLTRIVNGITVVGQQVAYPSALLCPAQICLPHVQNFTPVPFHMQSNGYFLSTYEHLGCWLPGGLALGAMSGAVNGTKAAYYLELAANMTRTCYLTYQLSPTGTTSLSPS